MALSRRNSLAILAACPALAVALTLGISSMTAAQSAAQPAAPTKAAPAATSSAPRPSPASPASSPASSLASLRPAAVAPAAALSGEAAAAAAVIAFRRGDLDETTRLFQRAGRAALAAAIAGDRTTAIAAMWAMRERAEPWPLALLATAAGSADRRRALAATAAATAIAARLDVERAEAEDLDGEALAGWQADWLAVARRAEGWIDVRSDALEVAALLGRVAVALGAEAGEAGLLAAVGEVDPALRRAAIELLSSPLSPAVRAELARVAVAEADPAVARAAAAVLCAELAGRIAGDVLGALGREGLTRIRELAKATTAAEPADVDLARCLAADGRPESRAALRALVSASRGQVRRALASVERGAR